MVCTISLCVSQRGFVYFRKEAATPTVRGWIRSTFHCCQIRVKDTCETGQIETGVLPLNYFENFSSVQWVEICLRKKQNSIFKKINLIVYQQYIIQYFLLDTSR